MGGKIMSEVMLAVLGFAAIIMVITLLLRNVTIPSIAFIGVGLLTSVVLVVTRTFSINEMGEFVKEGVADVHGTAALFIFSVLFFGIMNDVGMFDRIINALVKKVGDNVIGVTLMTCLIAMIGHLDGGGASTFLITIPAMLPIYKKLKMRPTTLLLICVTAMGVMNLLPWGGPTMRAATVLGIEANALWMKLIPMQIAGIVIAIGTALFWGYVEKKRGAGINSTLEIEDYSELEETSKEESEELARPKLFVFNVILTLCVIVSLIALSDLPAYFIFMVGCAIALLVNYSGSKLQNKRIKAHASSALMMASTILAAGVFLGVLESSGIMNNMATAIAGLMPAAMGRFLPIIIGVLSVPLSMMFCTDAYFFGLLPVLITVGNAFGVNPVHTAIAMVVCRNCATFISPVVPATYLGIGLAGVDIKAHIKRCFGWMWNVSVACLIVGIFTGVIKF
nr:citrate:proton symporter [Aequitasia blattaphilus]